MADANCKMTAGLNWDGVEPFGRWRDIGGTGVFATTDTSVVVYIPAEITYIRDIQITPIVAAAGTGAAVANGALTISGVTINADGTLTPATAGQITVSRAAGTDSALAFSFSARWR